MKTTLRTLLPAVLAALILPLSALADTETVDGIEWKYTVLGGEAAIGNDYAAAIPTSTSGAITIPATLGGYPVTSIEDGAFEYCSGLTSVIIPDSVTSIGDWAFNGCRGLTSVTISDSVTTIGDYAFEECYGLTSVTIPDSVTTIGEFAFEYCIGLTSVSIPNFVTAIGRGAFRYCDNLTSVTIGVSVVDIGNFAFAYCDNLASIAVDADNAVFDSRNNCNAIIRTADNTLVAGCKKTKIPNSVTSIGDGAFDGCESLTTVTIPNSVTSIGDWALGCSNLRTVYLPNRFDGKTGGMGIPDGCQVVFYSTDYTVKFNANGGKLPKGRKMASQTFKYGKAAKLRKNLFTRKGYVFIGWARSKKGAVAYRNAQSVKNLNATGGTTTLYAQWAKKNYKVAFYANGGKGKMAAQKMTYGKAKKLSANKFTRKGYVFKGWAKSKALAKKGKVAYKNRKAVKNLTTTGKTVKLYAVWKKK